MRAGLGPHPPRRGRSGQRRGVLLAAPSTVSSKKEEAARGVASNNCDLVNSLGNGGLKQAKQDGTAHDLKMLSTLESDEAWKGRLRYGGHGYTVPSQAAVHATLENLPEGGGHVPSRLRSRRTGEFWSDRRRSVTLCLGTRKRAADLEREAPGPARLPSRRAGRDQMHRMLIYITIVDN